MTPPLPTWDILMCSIWHRTEMLDALLAELRRQIEAARTTRVGVRVFRDNQEMIYGDKCQRLLDSSSAEYVAFLDDDDWIAEDYVSTIIEALQGRPDYVGFRVEFTNDGVLQVPVFHSLQYDGWINGDEALYRDLVHFNPIRRELALQGKWTGGDGADARWAEQLRALGCVKTEVFIDRELHHYRRRSHDTFVYSSTKLPMDYEPQRPAFDFVTWLES